MENFDSENIASTADIIVESMVTSEPFEDIESMRQQLITAIGTNNFMHLLKPIPIYTTHIIYKNNIRDILTILMKDRDVNGKFTINDVVLMGNDPAAMGVFMSALVLILSSIDKVKYSPEETERLLFKLCIYVLLITLPTECGKPLLYDEKLALINVSIIVYQYLVSTGIAKKLVVDAVRATKRAFSCCGAQKDDPLPSIKVDFAVAIDSARKNNEINSRLQLIEASIGPQFTKQTTL